MSFNRGWNNVTAVGANKLLAKNYLQLQTLNVGNCLPIQGTTTSVVGMTMMSDSKMDQLQWLSLSKLLLLSWKQHRQPWCETADKGRAPSASVIVARPLLVIV